MNSVFLRTMIAPMWLIGLNEMKRCNYFGPSVPARKRTSGSMSELIGLIIYWRHFSSSLQKFVSHFSLNIEKKIFLKQSCIFPSFAGRDSFVPALCVQCVSLYKFSSCMKSQFWLFILDCICCFVSFLIPTKLWHLVSRLLFIIWLRMNCPTNSMHFHPAACNMFLQIIS